MKQRPLLVQSLLRAAAVVAFWPGDGPVIINSEVNAHHAAAPRHPGLLGTRTHQQTVNSFPLGTPLVFSCCATTVTRRKPH
jgi:hypothetical protein